jgi:hypothetical protein
MRQLSHTKMLAYLRKNSCEFIYREGVNILFDGETLLSTKWLNSNRNYTWHKPPERKDTSTYRDCLDLQLTCKNDNIIAELIVWDGDNMWGTRTDRRCSFKFSIDKLSPLIKIFDNQIKCDMYYQAVIEHENIKRKDEEQAIQNILQSMIGELK